MRMVLKAMRIKANELFIFGFNGLSLSKGLSSFLKKHRAGGLILFKRNIESLTQVVALNSEIINGNEAPPFISVDQEGGRVARLAGITSDVPPLRQLYSQLIKDPERTYRLGALIGRELVSLGFGLNFAPVCDVPEKQRDEDIIGDRAFSDDAKAVALLSSHFIRGMQGAGLAACAKHFPGHGATSIDSHLALPTILDSEEQMRQRDLLPFKASIEAKVATIMTAHIVAKSFDSKMPATLSYKMLQEILRNELGFKGMIISDDLDMKAIADHYALKEIIEYGLMASVDMFIIGNNVDKTMEAIGILQTLIDGNEKIRNQAARAIERINQFRKRYVGAPAAPDLAQARLIVKSAPHLELLNTCSTPSV
jgi:beta-N-acetylhexosaminidase